MHFCSPSSQGNKSILARDFLELLASHPPPALPSTCLLSLGHQISSLKSRLKKVSTTTGDGVARAFLKAQAAFFGSYRNALKIEPVSNLLACYNKPMFGQG